MNPDHEELTHCKIVTFTFGPWIPSPGGPVGPAGPGLPTLPFKQLFKVISLPILEKEMQL